MQPTASLIARPRRLRGSVGIRRMVRETRLAPDDLIYPLFVRHGAGIRQPIASMPGIAQLSLDEAVKEAQKRPFPWASRR
jgi:porphobilinogen synthase